MMYRLFVLLYCIIIRQKIQQRFEHLMCIICVAFNIIISRANHSGGKRCRRIVNYFILGRIHSFFLFLVILKLNLFYLWSSIKYNDSNARMHVVLLVTNAALHPLDAKASYRLLLTCNVCDSRRKDRTRYDIGTIYAISEMPGKYEGNSIDF